MRKLNEDYEYHSGTELEGSSAKHFQVPLSVITNTELGSYRASVFCYFSSYRGIHSRTYFSIPMFLDWAGYKNDSHKNGINEKVLATVDALNDSGYLEYRGSQPLTKTSCTEVSFNTDLVYVECGDGGRFGIFYIDEIEKIMHYKNHNKKDSYLNSNTVLLVFTFLRCMITRRTNKLKPEERSPEGCKERKLRLPEAYNDTYKEIARLLGISERAVSTAVNILKDLELIVTVDAYRIKYENGEYRTQYTMFANMEKRDGDLLLTRGYDYAYSEIDRKAEIIKGFNAHYVLKPHGKQKEAFDNAG